MTDFYISDYKSGLRALVKVGYGASVTPHVEDNTIVDVTKKDRELSSNFLRWLAEHNLSSDDRIMRLKEGYVLFGFSPVENGDGDLLSCVFYFASRHTRKCIFYLVLYGDLLPCLFYFAL